MKEVKYIPGDLVNPNGNIVKVTSVAPGLGKGNIEIGFSDGWRITAHYKDFSDDILGVPLTPEILEKNGWKRNGGQYSFTYKPYAGDKVELIGFFIEMFKDEHDMLKYRYFQIFLENKVICGCFYVHQLQHLLFGLGINCEMEV